jgi:hypothetical protein
MEIIDYKALQTKMNARNPAHPVTEGEAAEALRNMAELVMLLAKINQRAGLVPWGDDGVTR